MTGDASRDPLFSSLEVNPIFLALEPMGDAQFLGGGRSSKLSLLQRVNRNKARFTTKYATDNDLLSQHFELCG